MKKLLFTLLIIFSNVSIGSVVKQSSSGICHDEGSRSYERTTNYKSYDTMDRCIEDGGRAYVGYSEASDIDGGYDRDSFNHWIDEDGDCLNTRHELLEKNSVALYTTGENKCTLETGKWYCPYTDKYYYNSKELDIDHVVPLEWAWTHGADKWDDDKRERFANDEANLLIVELSQNRSKGSKGPDEWMPENTKYHCQYLTKFKKIVLKYSLTLTVDERIYLRKGMASKCKITH